MKKTVIIASGKLIDENNKVVENEKFQVSAEVAAVYAEPEVSDEEQIEPKTEAKEPVVEKHIVSLRVKALVDEMPADVLNYDAIAALVEQDLMFPTVVKEEEEEGEANENNRFTLSAPVAVKSNKMKAFVVKVKEGETEEEVELVEKAKVICNLRYEF